MRLYPVLDKGIHEFDGKMLLVNINTDDQASDYLPRMCGSANYVMVADVRELPAKVSDINRKLTT